MAIFRKLAKFNSPSIFRPLLNYNAHIIRCTTLASTGIYVYVVAVDIASPAEVSTEGRPVLKYYTFSAKETKQVKGAQSDCSRTNLA